jgi:acyl carrier protein
LLAQTQAGHHEAGHYEAGFHEDGHHESGELPMSQVADECIALIAKQKSIAPEQIRLDSTLEELALDSLDRVSLAFDLEEKYDIEIPESKLEQIKTVRDMVTGIEEAVRQKSATPSASG